MTLSVSLSHRFGDFALDLAFDAPPGVTVLFGRSGSGKTTVVNAVAGLLRPDRGRIKAAGAVLLDTERRIFLPPHRRRVGYVFQDARLFPHLTVRQNLLYGRWFAPRTAEGVEFARITALLGIDHLLDRRPGALSGGEKSRVGIGRAILSKPRLLLMDEPLAALDEARKAEILPYLERLREALDLPILYVSHALTEVARLATTVVLIDAGKVKAAGPAAGILSDPALAPVLGLRDAGALVEARVAALEPDGLVRLDLGGGSVFVPHAPGIEPGARLRLRVPAQDVMIALDRPERVSALNLLPAVVTGLTPDGAAGVMVGLDIGGQQLLARITARSAAALGLAPGMAVHAVLKTVSVAPGAIGTPVSRSAG